MTLSFFDIALLVVILFLGLQGAFHGLIKEVFGKLAVIAGLFVAFVFCGMVAPRFQGVVNHPTVDIILAFLALFVITFIVVKIVQIILGKIFSGEILGSLNRVLGFFFGLVEGLLLVCCVLILVTAQPWFDASSLIEKSVVASILTPVLTTPVNYIHGLLA